MSPPVGQYKTPRREERYEIRLPIVLKIGAKRLQLFTGDISFRGLFICTDDPPILRQLISIEIELPPEKINFKSHGMSVYVLPPGDPDRPPGVGLQFYAQSEADRRKWERFVTYIRDNPPDPPEDAIHAIKRLHPRIDARFEVRPRDIEELHGIYTRDVSSGGMFLETEKPLELGRSLVLSIYHPVSRHSFTIDSVVRRCSVDPPRGLGVEFTGMDDNKRQKFQMFIKEGLAAIEELGGVIVEIDND